MTTAWVARLVACVLALLLGNSTPASASPAVTTTNSAPAYVYDVATVASVDVRTGGGVDSGSAQFTGLRERDVAPAGSIQGTSTTPAVLGNATNTATRIGDDVVAAGDDAFTHSYSYHPRLRERGLQDPVGHNFPYSYDDVILRSAPVTQADGSLLYRVPGSINGKDGFFEIAVNPTTQTIFHRTFVGG